jgi:hypothetical protein
MSQNAKEIIAILLTINAIYITVILSIGAVAWMIL